MKKVTSISLLIFIGILCFSNQGFAQDINTLFNDMSNQASAGQGGIKLLVGRILGIILIIVLGIFVGSIWLKPEYSKVLGVAFLIGALLYWASVQIGWLAV